MFGCASDKTEGDEKFWAGFVSLPECKWGSSLTLLGRRPRNNIRLPCEHLQSEEDGNLDGVGEGWRDRGRQDVSVGCCEEVQGIQVDSGPYVL